MIGGDPLRNYMLVLSYDGTLYHGFQFQKNALTIQEILEKSLERLYSARIKVEPAGRTDTGVHARGQVVNFWAPEFVPPGQIPLALNRILPRDIVVMKAGLAADDFNARRNARAKIYSYTIDNGFFPDVFRRNYAWHIYGPLDLEAMELGASFLLGKHDFKAFQASGGSIENTVRTLFSLSLEKNANMLLLTFQGDGFLYKMVRNMTGTLVEVGLQKRKPQEVHEILESKDRQKAGKTAPARGLCLEKVLY
jgi:tRNA pseudouridine38-40 synthase